VLEPGSIAVGDEMTLQPHTAPRPWQAAVITLSDKGARGEREDRSGPAIAQRLKDNGYEVVERLLLPDEAAPLKNQLIRLCDQRQLDLILTHRGHRLRPPGHHPGGPPWPWPPERSGHRRGHPLRLPGHHSPGHAVPGGVGHPGKTLIVNLPGSPKACMESMDVFLDTLPHALDLLRGRVQDCARRNGTPFGRSV
jgi:molybdopterin biosynthesis enzyme MoaB